MELPEDAWLVVLEFLAQSDLGNLARCSSLFQRLVEPVLYRSVNIVKVDEQYDYDINFLKMFVRTLWEVPRLRGLVRELNTRDGYACGPDPIFDVNVPTHGESQESYIEARGYVVPIDPCALVHRDVHKFLSSLRHERCTHQLYGDCFPWDTDILAWDPTALTQPLLEALANTRPWVILSRPETLPPDTKSYQALLMGLLTLLPKLRSLDFEFFKCGMLVSKLFEYSLESAAIANAFPAFAHLRRLRHCADEQFCQYTGHMLDHTNQHHRDQYMEFDRRLQELSFLKIYFKLPALECLQVYCAGRDGYAPSSLKSCIGSIVGSLRLLQE